MTDIGQTGPEKGKGAKFLILPPGSEDMHSDGYIVVRSPTMQVWFATRGLDPDPNAAHTTRTRRFLNQERPARSCTRADR
jgi:hypothetical protein